MLQYIQLYLVVLITFFVIDMIWIGVIAKKFYKVQLGSMMAKKINWFAAIGFYLLYIVGLLFFVIMPAIDQGSWFYALWTGAFFGLICYATYDLSNLATLEGWPKAVTAVDMVWGSSFSAILSVVGFLYGQTIF